MFLLVRFIYYRLNLEFQHARQSPQELSCKLDGQNTLRPPSIPWSILSKPATNLSASNIAELCRGPSTKNSPTLGCDTRIIKLLGCMANLLDFTSWYSLVGNQCFICGDCRATVTMSDSIKRPCKSPESNHRKQPDFTIPFLLFIRYIIDARHKARSSCHFCRRLLSAFCTFGNT